MHASKPYHHRKGCALYHTKIWVNGRYKVRPLHTADLKTAIKIVDGMNNKYALALAGLAEVPMAKDAPLSLETAWKTYADLPDVKAKAVRTRGEEENAWKRFNAWCDAVGIQYINQIDVPKIMEYRRELQSAKGRGGKVMDAISVNNYLRHVGTVFRYLNREHLYTGGNPFKTVEGVRVIRKPPKYRPMADAVAFVDACKKHSQDIYLFAVLGLYLGLRKKEILMMKWEYMDFARKTVSVRKTKPRPEIYTVKMYPELIERLLPYRRDHGYIVKAGNEAMTGREERRWKFESQWNSVFKTINAERKAAGKEEIKRFSAHILRHSLQTHLLSIGHSYEQVAAFVGHSDIASTKVYAKLDALRPKVEIRMEQEAATK